MTVPKICIFTETYYPVIGGGETQARLLAEGLVSNGFSVIILTRRSDPSLKKTEQFGAVTVYRLPPFGSGQLKKWGLLFSSIPTLIKLHRQYDLIFVSGFRIVGVAAVLVSKLFGKACVLKADSQGEMSGDFFKGGLAKLGLSPGWLPFRIFLGLRNIILKWASAFTAISSEIATELTTSGVHLDDIWMIPNGVDTTLFCPVHDPQKADLRRKLGLPETDKIVTYTGRLVSYKGLPLLLRVWQEIQRKHQQVSLMLVGSGGLDIHNCEDDLKAYVEVNDLQQSVHFTGSVQNVPEYLQASDIFVFPTENDAFPSSLVEAMTCCLPVVTTPVGAINTIVTDKQNGLIVQPGDFQQLYEALERIITDTSLASRLGQAGWQTVQDRYSTEIVTQKYINLFRQVANASGITPLTVDCS
jgi:glycosyltransferase involved in cell wall biosynthesis